MKPHIHAENSAKQFGGKPKDYIDIHIFMDCSKGIIADHRHRAMTHNTWFISFVLERVFGYSITNSDGTEVSVRDIGEQHVLEDFRGKFIPSAQDWLEAMELRDWMNNGGEEKKPRAKQGKEITYDKKVKKAKPVDLLKELKKIIPKQPFNPQPMQPPPWNPHGGQIID